MMVSMISLNLTVFTDLSDKTKYTELSESDDSLTAE